jgi:hypothetical protein
MVDEVTLEHVVFKYFIFIYHLLFHKLLHIYHHHHQHQHPVLDSMPAAGLRTKWA